MKCNQLTAAIAPKWYQQVSPMFIILVYDLFFFLRKNI